MAGEREEVRLKKRRGSGERPVGFCEAVYDSPAAAPESQAEPRLHLEDVIWYLTEKAKREVRDG